MLFFNLLLIVFALTACNPFADLRPDSEKIVKSGWAKNPPKPQPDSLYCYKTLGEHTCYTHPLKNGENRLAGDYSSLEGVPEEKTFLEGVYEDVKKELKKRIVSK
jgi:hypothetical protein